MKLSFKKFRELIERRILPFNLTENGISDLKVIFSKYNNEILVECVDIGISKYVKYDFNGDADKESVENFLSKLGGIAYNKSQNKIDSEIRHIVNIGKNTLNYWNDQRAKQMLNEYVNELRTNGYSEEKIVNEYLVKVRKSVSDSPNWTSWVRVVSSFHEEAQSYKKVELIIEQNQSIIPDLIFKDSPKNIRLLCQQINASYENSLFDCTAVMMRRLVEVLLILTYQKLNLEKDIIDINGNYFTLDRIMNLASQNVELNLTPSTKKQMKIFQDLGNFSAHKIWYNCTKSDIEPHLSKFRSTIEELMYKAGQII